MIFILSFICFALPSYLIRFKILGIPTTALEILIYFAATVQLFRFRFPSERLKFKNLIKQNLKIIILIILFLLAGIISVVISSDKRTSLGILKGWIFDPILLFGLIALNVQNSDDFKKIIYGLNLGGIIVSLWGISQFFGFDYLLPHQKADPFNSFQSYLASHRAFGPFESPNYLGMYLAPLASLTLGYWLKSRKQLFPLFIMLFGLFLTKSISAWLGFFVALTFLFWLYLTPQKRAVFLVLVILAIVASTVFIFNYRPARIIDSFLARKEVWRVSYVLIKKHPVLGIGLGRFKEVYNQTIAFVHFPPINWIQLHPHNLFLALWLNMGVLGLLSFLLILYLFFKKLVVHQYYLISAMLAMLVHGVLDTTYFKNDLSALFWIIMGLAMINFKFKNQNVKQQI